VERLDSKLIGSCLISAYLGVGGKIDLHSIEQVRLGVYHLEQALDINSMQALGIKDVYDLGPKYNEIDVMSGRPPLVTCASLRIPLHLHPHKISLYKRASSYYKHY